MWVGDRVRLENRRGEPNTQTQVDPQQIARITLFDGMDSGDLAEIAAVCALTHVPTAIRLVAAGESGFSFSMILSGTADVHVDGQTIATLGEGDVFGEMAIVTGAKRNADVVTTSAVVLASMMIWDFREMVEKHAEIQQRLDQLVAQRTGG